MLPIYLRSSFRHLNKNRLYTLINLAGLAAGITVMLLALLFWRHELSYERFHIGHENIYRITTTLRENKDNDKITVGATGQVQGPAFHAAIPDIKSFTRVMGGDIYNDVVANGNTFKLQPLFVDSNFLSVFTFPLIQGNPHIILNDKSRVVLTESTARKLFGSVDVTGKLIHMDADPSFKRLGKPLIVSGVVKDPPANSSLQFDMLLSFSFLQLSFTDEAWLNAYLGTFVVVNPTADISKIAGQFNEVYSGHAQEQLAASIKNYQFDPEISYGLQKLSDIHLHPLMRAPGTGNAEAGVINGSSLSHSIVFLVIAGFILLMASINFVNISIAGSLKRAKEVGVRKISGGTVKHIVLQFLTESTIVCCMAFLVSFFVMYLALPLFNELTGKQIDYSEGLTLPVVVSFLVLLVLIIGATGLYPAYLLSRFRPAEVLYNRRQLSRKSATTKMLVVLQFTPAIFLLIASIVYYEQMNFMRTMNLGFTPDHVIKTGVYGDRDYKKVKTFLQNELSREPSIKQVSFGNSGYNFFLDANQKHFEAVHKTMDENFLPLMEIPLLSGRNLSSSTADEDAAIVNESFVKAAGLEHPIGATIKLGEYYDNITKTITGVVKDHHHQSVRFKITPLIMFKPTRDEGEMWVKLERTKMQEGISALESIYKKAMPSARFEYAFIDELNAREFKEEERAQKAIGIGTILSLMICCLGLFGMAHLSVWQRVKEIGVRKVLGASVTQIVLLFSTHFLKLVAASFLIAVPISLIVMRQWLQDFAYRKEIGAGVVIIAALISIVVSMLAVFFQSFKAAIANPVNSLRNE